MKKRNNKGFVLAEAIISAVFVLGIFTFLIMNIFPLTSKYEKTLKYDNPEDIYFVNTLIDTIEEEQGNNLEQIINNELKESNYKLYKTQDAISFCTDICKSLIDKKYMNISHILLIKVTNGESNTESGPLTRGFKEYLKYFNNQIDSSKSGVAMLVRFENGHYASTFIEEV